MGDQGETGIKQLKTEKTNKKFMPMFVFISGYFNRIDESSNLAEYIKSRIKKLLLPFFEISILIWIVECFINYFRNCGITYDKVVV